MKRTQLFIMSEKQAKRLDHRSGKTNHYGQKTNTKVWYGYFVLQASDCA